MFVRLFLLFIPIAGLFACFSPASRPHVSKKNAEAQRPKPSFEKPLVFIRFSQDANSNEPLLVYYDVPTKTDMLGCQGSSLYRANLDICAPKPKNLKDIDDAPFPHPFSLTKTPKSFYWQQQLRSDKEISVELLDETGLPLPASVMVEKVGNVFTVTLQPLGSLPEGKKLSLMATQLSSDIKREQSWMLPVRIGTPKATSRTVDSSQSRTTQTPKKSTVTTSRKVKKKPGSVRKTRARPTSRKRIRKVNHHA